MTAWREQPLQFECEGESLAGILSLPAQGAPESAVLIVVGGPQYRAGSHRQFTLLARALAAGGHACLRFDYRGMGDASGTLRGFEHVSADIACALDALSGAVPDVPVFMWGLCDAASAIAFSAARDARVAGVAMANPWVRTVAGEARTMLKHYYLRRLVSQDFWRKLLGGGWNPLASLKSLSGMAGQALGQANDNAGGDAAALPDRMVAGLSRFDGKILVILSGQDYVSREFQDCTAKSPAWQALLSRARCVHLPEANHTFSSRAWRAEVETLTLDWLDACLQGRG